MAISAKIFTDMIQAAFRDPHLWGIVLAAAVTIGLLASIYIWAKNSAGGTNEDVI